MLQIENEYYSLVRPKQVPKSGETPSEALANRGVGYVELRAVDVNPYSPIGINEDTAGFLETLALFCLLKDSPALYDSELEVVERNQTEVVNRGRAPNASIEENGESILIEPWVEAYLNQMKPLAALLDETYSTDLYSKALNTMQQRVDEVDDTLSSQVVEDTIKHNGTWAFGSFMAQQHADVYSTHALSDEALAYFQTLSTSSLQNQQQLEQECTQSFDEYLAAFR